MYASELHGLLSRGTWCPFYLLSPRSYYALLRFCGSISIGGILPSVLWIPPPFHVLADPRTSQFFCWKCSHCPCDHNTCGSPQAFQFRPCQSNVHSVPPCNSRICDLRDYHTFVQPQCHLQRKSPGPANKCIARPYSLQPLPQFMDKISNACTQNEHFPNTLFTEIDKS